MYEDVNYNFNWVGLIIKIIIFVILILLAIWVVSMTVSKKDIKSNFEQNLQYFKETAINYFDNDKLPKNNNEKVKITLKELINKNIILELNDENGNICNTDESYVEVKNNDGEYELLIKLVCGEESKIIKTNIENNECVNEECDINKDDTQTNNAVSSNINDSNKNSNNNTNNLNTNDKKETYYEYVKVNKIYTP